MSWLGKMLSLRLTPKEEKYDKDKTNYNAGWSSYTVLEANGLFLEQILTFCLCVGTSCPWNVL